MKTVNVVSAVIVNEERKVLMALRNDNNKDYPNTWEIPGGKVDRSQGEDEREALVREVREELGGRRL